MIRVIAFFLTTVVLGSVSAEPQGFATNAPKVREFGAKNGYVDTTLSDSKRYNAFKNGDNFETQLAYQIDYSELSFVGVSCYSCAAKNMSPRDHALCKKEFSSLYTKVFNTRSDLSALKLKTTPIAGKEESSVGGADGKIRARHREYFRCKKGPHKGYEYTIFVVRD